MNPNQPADRPEGSWAPGPDPTHDRHSAWDEPDPIAHPTQHLPHLPPPSQQPPVAYPYAAAPAWPQAGGQPPAWVAPPNNHLVWAILVTLFCFFPFGIVAIIKATSVNTLWAQGRWAEAQTASASARTWSIWAMAAVPLWIMFWVIVAVAGAVARH